MPTTAHIAVDLGAESGRVMLGVLTDGQIALHECHRFEHAPLPTPDGLCWNLTGIWREVLAGLAAAAARARALGTAPQSVGVDAWGVDYALLGDGLHGNSGHGDSRELLGLPRCYRDPAFERAFAAVTARVPAARLYAATGIQLLPFNTLYQYAERAAHAPRLYSGGASLRFVPDILHWLLCGRAATERTLASTSQMLDARTGDWHRALLAELDLPSAPLPELCEPGTVLGPLTPAVAAATGLPEATMVVLPPTHDTAAAIAAVPARADTRWCYLSSGTWSLLGAELSAPRIDAASAAANFTNERGVAGTVRFLKNISGLWLVQLLRRAFAHAGAGAMPSYAELTEQAAGAEPLRTLVPANDPAWRSPLDLAAAIRAYARHSGQPVPDTPGQLVRCCLESLALEYRCTLDLLERTLGTSFDVLHVVGGGSKNGLLNRMAAHATGRRVVTGPVEATALGNVLGQAMGLGHVDGLAGVRAAVRASFALQEIAAGGGDAWQAAHARYRQLPPAAANVGH